MRWFLCSSVELKCFIYYNFVWILMLLCVELNEISCIDTQIVFEESCTLINVTDIAIIKLTCDNETVSLFVKDSQFHQFPRLFKDYPNLQTIDFSYAGIGYIESTTFDKAVRLTNLNLKGSNMPILQNSLFSQANMLTNLDFSQSSIETIQDHAFDGLSNLEILDLSYNNLVNLDEEIFQPLSQLEHIRLTNNKIEIISDNTFERNVHLKWAYFSSNKISSVESNAFKNCQLKTLDLANNQLSNVDVSAMKHLFRLIVSSNMLNNLYIPSTCVEVLAEKNSITVIQSEENNALEKLFLSSNWLSSLENFPNFNKLTFLDLSNNYLQSIHFSDLKNISHLTELKLSGNKLAVIDSNDLIKHLPQLKRIELSTKYWPNEYVEKLQNDLKTYNIELAQDRSHISYKVVTPTPPSSVTKTVTELISSNESQQGAETTPEADSSDGTDSETNRSSSYSSKSNSSNASVPSSQSTGAILLDPIPSHSSSSSTTLKPIQLGTSSGSDELIIDDIGIVPEDDIKELAKQNNITDFKENYFTFYNSTSVVDPDSVSGYWESFNSLSINSMLSRSHRRAVTVQLKFDFPFYGHPIRTVTVSTAGFLYTGEYVHTWEAATQYIAPLMANFDTSISNNSFVRFDDNGTAFTVLWQNVSLQDKEEVGQFTFSVTLHDTGSIVFAYYSLPILIHTIQDDEHPVKIGLSDGYIIDKTIFFARRKTIYEYHRVNFEGQDISNNTIITFTANPTCHSLEDCEKCVTSESRLSLKCYWCPTLNRCRTGTDRNRQEWLQKACDRTQISEAASCPPIGMKGNNYRFLHDIESYDDQGSGDEYLAGETPATNTRNDIGIVPVDVIKELAKRNNITEFKENYFTFYNSTSVVDPDSVSGYWESFNSLSINSMLSRSHRRAVTVRLKFDFPFFGHPIRTVTVSTAGFLYTGEYVHSWVAATQYIAPLMANFDTSISNNSFVRFDDNGTAFTVLWQNVSLQDKQEAGQFTFSVTLHDTGNIVFAYYSLPMLIDTIQDDEHPVKIGLSDGYIIDKTIFFARRKTIYEYHRVNFEGQDISNNTIITFTPNPTCHSLEDCEKCVTSESRLSLKCYWCPTLNRCSTGTERQEWLQKACDRTQISEVASCPAIGTKGNNYHFLHDIESNDDQGSFDKYLAGETPATSARNDIGIVSDDGIKELATKNNITEFKQNYFTFYNSTSVVDPDRVSGYWESFNSLSINRMLSRSHRRAVTVQLKFDFPFYGQPIRNVTVSTAGFLCTGEYVHSWVAATQYIAPLMANFDTSISNNSFVRFDDNGTAFTVLWQNVSLQDKEEVGQFTFSVTLHDTGNIVFAYYSLPMLIYTIQDDKHPVKIGLSNGYIIDKTIFFTRRKTIYEYHRVNFEGQDISNNTIITFTPNPTCHSLEDCEECVTSESRYSFKCYWCPTLNRCSTGTDRKRQQWLQKACDRTQIIEAGSCPAIGTKGNNYRFLHDIESNDDQGSGDEYLTGETPATSVRNDIGIVPEDDIKELAKKNNITEFKENYFTFYNSTSVVDPDRVSGYWESFNSLSINRMLSRSHRRAVTVQLKFDFPFYGQPIRNVTVSTAGFLCTGEYVHSWVAATQYIAPLMANFDTSISNNSFVRFDDNGTSFTVLWQNVSLQDKEEVGQFTFSVTLHDTGNIVFAYYSLPMLIDTIQDDEHPVKIGLSDGYIIDKTIFFARRKTIYEYHRVNFEGQGISNNTIITFTANPTCHSLEDCEKCVTSESRLNLMCYWCPTLNRCSTGTDRKRQEWLQKACDRTQISEAASCPAIGTKGNNYRFLHDIESYDDQGSGDEYLAGETPATNARNDIGIVSEDGIKELATKNNIAEFKENYFTFYNSTSVVDPDRVSGYWESFNSLSINRMLSRSHRRAVFDFPIYGQPIRNVTVATGGFLYTGDYVHSWLAATQYIAPLMANFDTSISNNSFVRFDDNGTAFTVLWQNVSLQDKEEVGQFTFSVTLHDTGNIVFAYYSLPLIDTIRDDKHPVKIGLSDGYIIDKTIFSARRKTIYEYDRVNFVGEDISNNTIITFTPNPTCHSLEDCEKCVTSESRLRFKCYWCPTLNRCSTGTDRKRQQWLQKACDITQVNEAASCPAIGTKGNNYRFLHDIESNDDQGSFDAYLNGETPATSVPINNDVYISNAEPLAHNGGICVGIALGLFGPIILVMVQIICSLYATFYI